MIVHQQVVFCFYVGFNFELNPKLLYSQAGRYHSKLTPGYIRLETPYFFQ